MDGYHIVNPDGSYDGMDVEYLKSICQYTDWEIEYVECKSWEEALLALKEKKVDLVGSAQYSAERAEEYQYADLASGYTFGVIAVNKDSSLAYEDFIAMSDKTFGMVNNYVRETEFFEYMSDYGISRPNVVKYNSTKELQDALSEGKIDALVHTFTEIRKGQRLIGRFAPRPFYYISYKGNDDVMRDLNQAIADLKINQPELEAELMNTFYYSKFDKAALLTTGEKKYLENTESLSIGYIDGHYPFTYLEDGELKGLTKEMLESSLSMTGLRLEYAEYGDEDEARAALKDGKIDVLSYCTGREEDLKEQNLIPVRAYAEIPLVLVMDKNRNVGEIKSIATVPYLKNYAESAATLKNASISTCSTQDECINQITEGNADAALCDGYIAEHLFRTSIQYEDLQIKNIFSGGYSVYIVVNKGEKVLSKILSKTTASISFQTINEYMLKENSYPLASLKTFFEDHSMEINLIIVAIAVFISLAAWHIVKDERKIRKLMYKDTSMDIWNMNYLIYWGERKLLPEQKERYALASLNLSQFRHFNIIYGWSAGEELLEGIARILKESLDKKLEICAKNQGDRFVLLLSCSGIEDLGQRLKTLKNDVEKYIYEKTQNRMNLRMGVYLLEPKERDLKHALNYAGQAIEFTGDKEDNSIKIYDSKLEEMIKDRHEREKLLQSVDINENFAVYYQPKVDIRSGQIVGAEALVRFLNPQEGGAVKAPGFFIPYYEKTGRVTEIDFFVYESVCKMMKRRKDEGKKVVPVSCNFSRMHFIKPGFVERFEDILNKYEVDKELIEVEITETLVIEELQQNAVKKTLDILSQRGIRLSIDDFGAGYSSLGVFEQIPASVVKLDRSFLLNQEDHKRQVAIMCGIVNMTKNLNVQVVCEGVETETDINLMREIGAYVAQGYYYFKPIPEIQFEEKLG